MEGDHVHGGGRHLPMACWAPSFVTTASQQAACQQGKGRPNVREYVYASSL